MSILPPGVPAAATLALIGGSLAALFDPRRRPLRRLQRWIIVLRAANMMKHEMIDGARSRLSRWDECVQRAMRE